MPPWDNGALFCSVASRCPGEDPGLAVPLENSQIQEEQWDDALSCKDALSDGMIEHLSRMWAHSHLPCDGSVEHPCSLLWSRMVLPAVPPLCKDFLFLIWADRLLSCNPGACLRPKQPGFYQFFQGWFSTLPNDCTSWLEVKTPSLLGAKHQSLQEIQVFKLKANPTWNDSGQTGKAEDSLSNSEEAWGFSLL